MTTDSKANGQLFTILLAIAVVAAVALTFLVIMRISPGGALEHLLWSAEAVGVAAGSWMLLTWPARRRNAGRVLQDITDRKSRITSMLVLLGSGMMVLGWKLEGAAFDPAKSLAIPLAVVAMLTAMVDLRFGVKLTERGVLRVYRLVPFDTREISHRVETIGGLLVFLSFCAVAVSHAWLAPGGYQVAAGVVVRFVEDDAYGQPTIVFVRVPDGRLRAVMEQRRGDGTVAEFASVDLGQVRAGQELSVRWGRTPDSLGTSAHAFHLSLLYQDEIRVRPTPRPFPSGESPIVMPGLDHPIDGDGAIVMAYSLDAAAPDVDFADLSPSDVPHKLVLRFEPVE